MSETANSTTARATEHTATLTPRAAGAGDERTAVATWIEAEFPGWSVDVDETTTWEGELRPLWIARRDGHHPQSELSAAKLHTRLSDYHDREQRRNALAN